MSMGDRYNGGSHLDMPPAPTTGPGGFSYEYHDFTGLLDATPRELVIELIAVHTELANLVERIALIRSDEPLRQPNRERVIAEGSRDALSEKKWLIMKLLEGLHR